MVRLLIILGLLLFGTISFAQSQDYLAVREVNFKQGIDITSSDKDFVSEHGEILPALLKEIPSAPLKTFQFYNALRNLTPQNQENVINRMKNLFPSLINMQIDGNKILVAFSNPFSDADLEQLVKLFGYKGFKVIK